MSNNLYVKIKKKKKPHKFLILKSYDIQNYLTVEVNFNIFNKI